jgi:hypothetical protein
MMIKGAVNGKAFLAYVDQCLVPTLKPMPRISAAPVVSIRCAIESNTPASRQAVFQQPARALCSRQNLKVARLTTCNHPRV